MIEQGAGVPMSDILRVTRDDLLAWASGAQDELPFLVRRLVVETANGLAHYLFPGGSGVSSGGWDGWVEASGSSLFVPSGKSGWELSVNKKSRAKAEADFDKRSRLSAGQRAGTTYVQVICQPWTKASSFVEAAKQSSKFDDVWALNVDSIEQWLENAPQTSLWFRERIDKPVAGVESVDAHWESWISSTAFPLDVDLVLAGRADKAEELRQRLGTAGITTVGGRHEQELRTFVAAACAAAGDEPTFASPLIVTDPKTASALLSQHPSAAVVLTPEVLGQTTVPETAQLILLEPGSIHADLLIPPIDAQIATSWLQDRLPTFRRAEDDGALARRSLAALRRRHANKPAQHRPPWAVGVPDRALRRLLLVGRWTDRNASDKQAISDFAELSWADLDERAREMAAVRPEPVFGVLDRRWFLISQIETWLLLGNHLTVADLEGFSELAATVLLSPDPARWQSVSEQIKSVASGDHPAPSNSEDLRQGIAESLALLGVLNLDTSDGAWTGENVANAIVGRLLCAANEDATFEIWRALTPQLPLLAEAAPDEFIAALEAGMAGEKPVLAAMFEDTVGTQEFGSPRRSPHTHFVFALKRLAWSPVYLSAAVQILARFDDLDPGGDWGDRPGEAIESLVKPIRPNTLATWPAQQTTLETLFESWPALAWKVLESMLPLGQGGLIDPGPAYRDWKPRESAIPPVEELASALNWIVDTMLAHACSDAERWESVIAQLPQLLFAHRTQVLESLAEVAVDADEALKKELWPILRATISRHRQFSDAEWSLPEDEVQRLEQVLAQLAPESLVVRAAWLFEPGVGWVDGVSRFGGHRDEFESRLRAARQSAVEDLIVEGGFEQIIDFSAAVSAGGHVGIALADASDEGEFDERMVGLLPLANDDSKHFPAAYFRTRFEQQGWDWFEDLVDRLHLPADVVADLCMTVGDAGEAIDRLADLGSDVSDLYWSRIGVFALSSVPILDSLARLKDVGRVWSALLLIAVNVRTSDRQADLGAIAISFFEHTVGHETADDHRQLDGHHWETLFSAMALHRSEAQLLQRAATVEWSYLNLSRLGPLYEPPSLYARMATDANFYCEIASMAYNSQEGDTSGVDPLIGRQATTLLLNWKGPPGAHPGQEAPSAETLQSWVEQARAGFAETDRKQAGDYAIGQLLVSAPSDKDDNGDVTWPPASVRSIIQGASSTELDRGFEDAVRNGRGIRTATLYEGGDQETDLADRYDLIATDCQHEAPRVARIFRRIASTYRQDASAQDERAETRRQGID